MSCTYRVFVLIFLMLLSACATCAILFPIFRKPNTTVAGVTSKNTVYYWYSESSTVSSTSTAIARIYSRTYSCESEKNYFTASSALAVAGAGLGGLACMFMACWVSAGHRAALGVISLILTFFAFACCVVVVSLTAYMYVTVQCPSTVVDKKNYKQQDYKLVEGFILMAVAAGGFLILFFVQIIGMCCGFCCGSSNYDDVSRDLSRHSSKSSRDSGESYTRQTSRSASFRN